MTLMLFNVYINIGYATYTKPLIHNVLRNSNMIFDILSTLITGRHIPEQ